MLAIPEKGFRRSIAAHNVDLVTCCDWLEACALFKDGVLAGSDAVDLLRENEIYADQNFAWQLINDVFGILRERKRFMGEGYPFEFQQSRLSRRDDWQQFAPYSFCLALSLATAYPTWSRAFGKNFTEQGALFEELTAESVRYSLVGWNVHPTGWTRQSPSKLKSIVNQVATHLGEATGDVITWTKEKAKEAGLDIVCYKAFPDQRGGRPAFMVQCASGGDWESKLKTPDLRIWSKLISFISDPKKAFSTPFALSDREYKFSCNLVDGLLLDRHRLLAPGHTAQDWIPAALAARLVAWTNLRVGSLPDAEVA